MVNEIFCISLHLTKSQAWLVKNTTYTVSDDEFSLSKVPFFVSQLASIQSAALSSPLCSNNKRLSSPTIVSLNRDSR